MIVRYTPVPEFKAAADFHPRYGVVNEHGEVVALASGEGGANEIARAFNVAFRHGYSVVEISDPK